MEEDDEGELGGGGSGSVEAEPEVAGMVDDDVGALEVVARLC